MYWYRDNELVGRLFRCPNRAGDDWMIVCIYEAVSGFRAVFGDNGGKEKNILIEELDGEFVGPIEPPTQKKE